MKIKNVALAITVFAAFEAVRVQASDWQAPAAVNVMKICGKLTKEKTKYDGVQSIFQQVDEAGNAVATYLLRGIVGTVSESLNYLKPDTEFRVCVLGVPSSAQSIDSPTPFYTLELLGALDIQKTQP